MNQAVRVKGLKELIRACDAAGKEIKKRTRNRLRRAAEIVASDARSRFSRYSSGSAAGFRPIVRRTGIVAVEQRRRKTTGLRADWGSLQMRRGLIPALFAKRGEVERELENVVDEIINEGF